MNFKGFVVVLCVVFAKGISKPVNDEQLLSELQSLKNNPQKVDELKQKLAALQRKLDSITAESQQNSGKSHSLRQNDDNHLIQKLQNGGLSNDEIKELVMSLRRQEAPATLREPLWSNNDDSGQQERELGRFGDIVDGDRSAIIDRSVQNYRDVSSAGVQEERVMDDILTQLTPEEKEKLRAALLGRLRLELLKEQQQEMDMLEESLIKILSRAESDGISIRDLIEDLKIKKRELDKAYARQNSM